MIYVFLAQGFEEAEALIPVDILRRAGLPLKTVGVGGKEILGAHGIPVICDITENQADFSELSAIILPGGMPGTTNLEKSGIVQQFIDFAYEKGLVIAAICAAPSILGHKGILRGKRATCYSGFEKDLTGAFVQDDAVVDDQNIITACGAGAAFDFGFRLLTKLTGDPDKTEDLRRSMRYGD